MKICRDCCLILNVSHQMNELGKDISERGDIVMSNSVDVVVPEIRRIAPGFKHL